VVASACILVSSFAYGCSSGSTSSTDHVCSDNAQNAQAAPAVIARPATRIFLTSTLLQRLKTRASSGDTAWTALKQKCDALSTATMNPPSGDAYPNGGNVGQGYQGEEYLPPLMSLGLCYRASADGSSAQQSYGV